MYIQLTVFFEDPFWIGIVEREDERGYAVGREVFGREPTMAEIREWVLDVRRRPRLVVAEETGQDGKAAGSPRRNPKRAQREAARALAQRGPSSKAADAMKEIFELVKKERRVITKAEREAEQARRRALHGEKQKQRRRGH